MIFIMDSSLGFVNASNVKHWTIASSPADGAWFIKADDIVVKTFCYDMPKLPHDISSDEYKQCMSVRQTNCEKARKKAEDFLDDLATKLNAFVLDM